MALDPTTALDWASARRHAVLITTKADGSPQSSDVTYTVADGAMVVSVTDSRAKTRNMRRDPRIILHVTDPGSWSYLAFSGSVEIGPTATSPDDAAADDLVDYYRAVAGEHDDWAEYRAAMVDEGRLLLRLRPERAVGQIH